MLNAASKMLLGTEGLAVCVLQGKIKSLEQIFLFSLPVKEYQIVESFLQSSLKDEVMKIMPVQKQTRAGQRTRFKVLHALGAHDAAMLHMPEFPVLDQSQSKGHLQMLRQVNGHGMLLKCRMLSNAIGVELSIQASARAFLCNSLKEMWHVALQHDDA